MRTSVLKLDSRLLLKPASLAADEARARLVRLLPRLQVTLKLTRDKQHVKVPTHVLEALTQEYGSARAGKLLKKLGLSDARESSLAKDLRDELCAPDGAARALWRRVVGTPPPESKNGGKRDEDKETAQRNWHLELCDAALDDEKLRPPGLGKWGDLKVGQIDTGYTEHPALGFPDGGWVITGLARSFDGLGGAPGKDRMRGAYAGHGTSSASICAGYDSDARFSGVAPRVPFIPVRVGQAIFLDQRAHEFEAAVRYLVDEAKVKVINVSMGTCLAASAPEAIWRAVNHCYSRGVLLVAAAGNVPLKGWPAYPGALPRSIAVAGVERTGQPWILSSSGEWVDISAPAAGVRRAMTGKTSPPTYNAASGGTTCAAAMVSGAAARWLYMHRDALNRYSSPWQRVEGFRRALRKSASRLPDWNADAGYGAGILNIRSLLETEPPPAAELTQR